MGEEEDKKKKEDEEAAKKRAEELAEQKKRDDEEAAKSNNKNDSNPIEEARKINEEKAKLLDREEALQAKKEKFHAEQMVGGHTQAGQADENKKPETDEEFTDRFKKGEVNVFDDK